MVELPKVQRRLALTEAPRAGISAEQAGGPFAQAAQALGKFGEGVENVGVRLAEEEGLRAVQTGPDGKPEFVPQAAFTGRAGEAYNRAGLSRRMAELQTATEADYTQARLDYRGNPEGFQEWSKTYIDTLVSKETDERMKVAIRNQLTSASNQAFRAITTEKQNLDIESSATALKRRQDLVENNISSLIQQGTPIEAPELRALLSDRAALVNERAGNPLYRYSRQEAELDARQFETKNTALGLVGLVRRTASNDKVDSEGKPLGGLQKAETVAESILTDPRLNDLTLEQRHHFYRLAVAEVRALGIENQVLVNHLNAEGQQWRKAIEKGDADPESIRDYLTRAASGKALRGFTAVTNAVALNEQLRGWFDRLPPEERTKVQLQLEGKLGSLADRIIRAESGNDPFAAATTSTARGAGQFIERTWLALIQRHRPELAATATREELLAMRSIPELTREMVMRNAEESRYLLAKSGVRADDTALYLAHFLGAGDAIKVLQSHSSKPIAEVLSPEVLAANPGVFKGVNTVGDLTTWSAKKVSVPEIPSSVQSNPAFLNSVRARRKQELDQALPTIEKRIRQGQTVNDEELEEFGALVFSVGTKEQRSKALELAVLARTGQETMQLGAKQRADVLLDFSRAFSVGATRLESEIGLHVKQINEAISADYKSDPYDAAVRYGKRSPVAPLDFSNPDALSAGLRARVREQEWIKQQEGTGPFSLLRPAEAETLRGMLLQADGSQALNILSQVLKAGNEDAVTATLGSEPLKVALNGMIRSGETQRMSAAFSTLDQLWQRNPQQFEASFGKDTYNKLAVWQANLSYRKPDEIADMLRRAEDPQNKTAREKLLVTYAEEANKLSDTDLLSHFSKRLLGVTISAALPASTPMQMQVFRQEFAGIYATLRADGVDQTNATERAIKWVSRAWGVSAANENRLMRRPPENYLPQVNGTHAWVEREVRDEVQRVLGPQYSPVVGGLKRDKGQSFIERSSDLATLLTVPTVNAVRNWQYALVADPQTEGELSRFNQWKAQNPGKTPPADLWPSYSLVVFDNDKREINLLDRNAAALADNGPFNIGSSAALSKRPSGNPRFKWSDTAMRASERAWPEKRELALEKQTRRDSYLQLFPSVLSAGSVPIRPVSDTR